MLFVLEVSYQRQNTDAINIAIVNHMAVPNLLPAQTRYKKFVSNTQTVGYSDGEESTC
jgi:hypothetical protein